MLNYQRKESFKELDASWIDLKKKGQVMKDGDHDNGNSLGTTTEEKRQATYEEGQVAYTVVGSQAAYVAQVLSFAPSPFDEFALFY